MKLLRGLAMTGVVLALACTLVAAAPPAKDFGSVGLQVVPTIEGDLVVLRVVEATPAANQGVRPGDLIVRVDDFVLKGSDFGKVVAEHLWGPVGSRVTLHYLRPGVAGPQSVVLNRIRLEPALTITPAAQGGKAGSNSSGTAR